jgi:hypothetical protein
MLTRYLGFTPILGLVLCAILVIAALIDVSHVLSDDIAAMMTEVAAYHDPHDDHIAGSGMDLMVVDSAPPESSVVLRLIFISLYLGGVPVAVTAIVLAAWTQRLGHRWRAGWGNVFLAGFVFQTGSLLFTTLMLYVFVVAIGYGHDSPGEAVIGTLLLTGSVASSAIALWSWRVLRGSVVEERLRIVG